MIVDSYLADERQQKCVEEAPSTEGDGGTELRSTTKTTRLEAARPTGAPSLTRDIVALPTTSWRGLDAVHTRPCES